MSEKQERVGGAQWMKSCWGRSLTSNVASLYLSKERESYERRNANTGRDVRVCFNRWDFRLEKSWRTYKLPSIKMAKMASFRPLNFLLFHYTLSKMDNQNSKNPPLKARGGGNRDL